MGSRRGQTGAEMARTPRRQETANTKDHMEEALKTPENHQSETPFRRAGQREHSGVSLTSTESPRTGRSGLILGKNSTNIFINRHVIIGMSAIP